MESPLEFNGVPPEIEWSQQLINRFILIAYSSFRLPSFLSSLFSYYLTTTLFFLHLPTKNRGQVTTTLDIYSAPAALTSAMSRRVAGRDCSRPAPKKDTCGRVGRQRVASRVLFQRPLSKRLVSLSISSRSPVGGIHLVQVHVHRVPFPFHMPPTCPPSPRDGLSPSLTTTGTP